ncbi:hypothetical protein R5R35_001982 [Gryllus longicercus]|uniref:Uncharacterized protein n=1 Tax=Gryllus longicercus TaxID=2509291 RepID=A0AAN9VJB5_9ORTH
MGSASSRRGDAEGLPSLLQAAAAPGHAAPPTPPAPAHAPPRRPPSSVRIPLRSEPTLDSDLGADGDAAPAPAHTHALTELQEIQDLEKTFDSLGIPLKVDDNANVSATETFRYQTPHHDGNPKPEESMKCEVSVLLESIPDAPEKLTLNGNQPVNPKLAAAGLSRQSDLGLKINDSIAVAPRTNLQSSELQSEEDWSYSQKDIEGFDVEKFRKANRKVIEANETFSLTLIRNNKSTTLHPLHFPSYDSTEEQLLAGIEEEFGS